MDKKSYNADAREEQILREAEVFSGTTVENTKDSELLREFMMLEKEVIFLQEMAYSLIKNIDGALAPEADTPSENTKDSESLPDSPISQRLKVTRHDINRIAKQIMNANERVRI